MALPNRKQILSWGTLICSMILVSANMGCEFQSPEENETDPPPIQPIEKTWQTIETWRGQGDKTTEVFTVKTKPWRIHYSYKGLRQSSRLMIYVYREGDIYGKDHPIADLEVEGFGDEQTSYVNRKGRFYLSIQGIGTSEWIIAVEEKRWPSET